MILIVETLLHIKGINDRYKLYKKIQDERLPGKRNLDNTYRKNEDQTLVMTEFIDAIIPLMFAIASVFLTKGI